MDTNKIYAEAIVNEYSEKKESKVMALKKLDRKGKITSKYICLFFWNNYVTCTWIWNVFIYGSNRR